MANNSVLVLKRACQLCSINMRKIVQWHKVSYSMYAPTFVEPVYKKQDQAQLKEMGEDKKYANIPIRAAKSDQTSSVFHDPLIRKFTNHVMLKGKKLLARELMEKAFANIKRIQLNKYYNEKDEEARNKIVLNPPDIFHAAIKNTTPVLQVCPVKRGGITYQVPMPVADTRALFLSIKWIIEAARDKEKHVKMPETLAREFIDASNNVGRVVRRKQELHKLCEANRAYAHYRWGK